MRIFLTILLPLVWATAAPAQQVGVTSAASGDPRGTPPSLPTRTLRVGIDVFGNERVTTGPADRAHLVFLDGSGLTVGANSELVIDKFVFDPNTNVGDLAVNATKEPSASSAARSARRATSSSARRPAMSACAAASRPSR